MLKLILASASPRRKDLLRQIGVEFTALPADIDESAHGYTDAGHYVAEMARQKAVYVAQHLLSQQLTKEDQTLVLGADTTVEIDGSILGKPNDYDDAYRMLELIQGKWHQVKTGIALVNAKTMHIITEMECSRVKMRDMTDEMIRAYLKTGESFDKAGSYGVQGYGSVLVEKIEGCYFNVMGLPLYRLSTMLERSGHKMLSWIKPQV